MTQSLVLISSSLSLLFVLLLFALPARSQIEIRSNPGQADLDANDDKVLKFALTLESLEYALFNQFNAQFNESGFLQEGYNTSVFTNFQLIEAHQAAHIVLLNSTLFNRTGEEFGSCYYNFSGITNVSNYAAVARLITNIGTFAYDGSIDSLYNKSLQQAAATIATVQARYAAYLNRLPGNLTFDIPGVNQTFPPNSTNQTNPFPNAFDVILQPPQVAALLSAFIANCTFNLTEILPTVIAVIPVPALNATAPQNPTQENVTANDVAAFNFALTLEILEASFYNQFLAIYTVDNFTDANYTALDYDYFKLIRDHENAHVAYLNATLIGLGATPITNCTYNFTLVDSVATFVGIAQVLENTGVSAYDGAINTINNPAFREAAATVATVEARHAAYLNQLVGISPFPNATDTPLSPDDVLAIVTKNFIISCPTPPRSPKVIIITPYNGTIPNISSSSSLTSSTGGGSTTNYFSTSSTSSTSTSSSSLPSSSTTGLEGFSSASSLSALGVLLVLPLLAPFLW